MGDVQEGMEYITQGMDSVYSGQKGSPKEAMVSELKIEG